MKKLVSMFLDSGWKSIVAAFFCFGISAIGLLLTSLCNAHGEGTVEKCTQDAVRNPFIILSLLLAILLGVMAVRKQGSGARRVLLWWAMLLIVFAGWWFTLA